MFNINYTQELTINKLIVLYLLNNINVPISNATITQFILEKNYTDYFSLQQYLAELLNAKLIDKHEESTATFYSHTKKGLKTLNYFVNKIPENIRSEIDIYINENKTEIKKDIEVVADYIPKNDTEFIVNCKINESNMTLLDLQINVASKEQAKLICSNWEDEHDELYSIILANLTKPNEKN
ncbi:MAG: DUF4364 family protein [Clostridia bacterium]|jgi:predicted transcriptional regulator|nr:DUF4364 family protein [Clostridia bacterium]